MAKLPVERKILIAKDKVILAMSANAFKVIGKGNKLIGLTFHRLQ